MRFLFILLLLLPELLFAQKVRGLADTVGFAHTALQMDSVMARIEREYGKKITEIRKSKGISDGDAWKMVICPHDDHTYASYMYPLVLKNVTAKTVILIGVAHKAKQMKLQDQIIFDSYTHWKGCYGNIKVSPLRERIISQLPKEMYEVNDSMQTIEHSVEGILPFLQYYHRNVEIISILVPYNSFENMDTISISLARSIEAVIKTNKLQWGKDIALVISTDAVHYGDEDWGGRNFARYGADTTGYEKAVAFEKGLMDSCFAGNLTKEKVQKFCDYTVKKEDYKEYLWTWCGRYSVPMGLLTGIRLAERLKIPLTGTNLDYSTSLSNKHIKVDDLGLGITAPAKIRHWVGYAGVGFR